MNRLPSELLDLTTKAYTPKTSGDPRSQRGRGCPLFPDGVAQDLADFFLGAPAVAPGASLKFLLDVVVELTHHKLGHIAMYDITIASRAHARCHRGPRAEQQECLCSRVDARIRGMCSFHRTLGALVFFIATV